jgi:hypothetical protein
MGDVAADLIGQGWVAEVPPVSGATGRPARRYRFRADAGHVLGLDIGGDKVLAAVTDLARPGPRSCPRPRKGRLAR